MASTLSLVPSTPDPQENSQPSLVCVPDAPDVCEVEACELEPSSLPPATTRIVALEKETPQRDLALTSPSDAALNALRLNLSDRSQSPDSLIRAAAEAARVLTGADGVAIAFRTKGVILCRARSGELAPDLGSCVNANSGISGECLRTASILICHDARTDARVDNAVCERLGIRSIVVVPLRGPVGISGILEVFSAHANSFGDRDINSLRGLAEVAEAAYERERQAQQEATRAALRSAHRLPALLARAAARDAGNLREYRDPESDESELRPERFWWVAGLAAVALLLILGVWLSWRGPVAELAEMEAAESAKIAIPPASVVQESLTVPKPGAGITPADTQKTTRSTLNIIRVSANSGGNSGGNSSKEDSAAHSSSGSSPAHSDAAETRISADSDSFNVDQAPAVTISPGGNANEFGDLISAPQELPVMSTRISQGVKEGELLRKVDPVYPFQARAHGISGPVVLEIHVAGDGTVRRVRTVSGDPQLALAAVKAVSRWQYAPTLLDGHPIEATRQVTVLFKLP